MMVDIYKSEKVHLSKDVQLEVTRKVLRELIHPAEYLRLKDGKIWVMQDDPYWRHGSISEEKIREATEIDIAVFKVLEYLK